MSNKMTIGRYALIGFASSFLGCAPSIFYNRNDEVNYKVICNDDRSLEVPGISAYGFDFSSRQVCLEGQNGEKFSLNFRGKLKGKARKLEEELSDTEVGEEISISSGLIKNIQEDIFDGCIVAGIK